jgi:hypothetical protein
MKDPLHVAIVHVADIMVTATGEFGHSGDHHVPPLNPEAWDRLQLPAESIPQILQEVAEQLDDLTSSLRS